MPPLLPASLLVTPYAPADADELVHMWHASFEHGVGITDPHPVESRHAYLLREVVPAYTLRVARRDGAIVGFMASTPETIAHLYVRVGCIGQGIGRRLLGLAKEASRGSLWLHAFSRNTNACRFYERHGFREVERESANMYEMEAIRYVWEREAPR
jgi:ribosomal protein S18 acetylase RimI-like enzyme